MPLPKIHFSNRELDCLHLLMRGYTAKRIGQHLGISPRTVEDFLQQLKYKFGAASKSQLTELAIDYFLEIRRDASVHDKIPARNLSF